MTPTLEDHDRLVVNKLAYRWHKPAIGDIVMVASPHKPDTMLAKRIVAGPGDVVRSVEGRVYRNDVLVPDDFVSADERSFDDWGPVTDRSQPAVLTERTRSGAHWARISAIE
jgi:signal peptidase I